MRNCCCGHVDEEHAWRNAGPVECEADGCDCIQFDWDGEPDA